MIRILGTCAVPLLVAFAACPAYAQRSYSSYCAQFDDGSGTDCSYSSLQSCLASVSCVGGVCIPNPRSQNQPPPPSRPGFVQRLLEGTGPAFAPVDVGPPPDSGLPRAMPAARPTGNGGRYCATFSDSSSNCSYPSFASCQWAVSGVGGTCAVNPRVSHALPRPFPSH